MENTPIQWPMEPRYTCHEINRWQTQVKAISSRVQLIGKELKHLIEELEILRNENEQMRDYAQKTRRKAESYVAEKINKIKQMRGGNKPKPAPKTLDEAIDQALGEPAPIVSNSLSDLEVMEEF